MLANNDKLRVCVTRNRQSRCRTPCARKLIWILIFCAGLVLANGCSPELLLAGAIVVPVVYAHTYLAPKSPEPQVRAISPRYSRHASRAYHTQSHIPATTSDIRDIPRREDQPSPPTVRGSRVAEAIKAYQDLQWDKARRLLNHAVSQDWLSRRESGAAHLLLGAMDYQTGQTAEAKKNFIKAHEHDPEVVPSAEVFPPPMVDFFEAVCARNRTRR